MPEAPLPDLHEGSLDPETLRLLCTEVASHGTAIEVALKGQATARAQGATTSPMEACEALLRGDVRGVQLRYRFEGAEWWDTLLRRPDGFQLVRIRHDWGGTS